MTDFSPVIIAIDGTSASGKGTVARRLAAHFDFAYMDTGLLYRAVGVGVLRKGGDPSDPALAEKAARSLNSSLVIHLGDDPALRADEASVAASKVAAIPAVRAILLAFQKDFCAFPPNNKKGAILDGRDIGTIIAPEAQVKIFITASPEIRAERRVKELRSRGQNAIYRDVLADMNERDARDAERLIAPTKPAPDAIRLDTTDMTAEQAFSAALTIVETKI